jgi:predicted lactoylglutathione lyase
MNKNTVLQAARPATNLHKTARMYSEGLDLEILAEFRDHNGFDGVIIGRRNSFYHLEFTKNNLKDEEFIPSKDNLLVFYIEQKNEWQRVCKRMENAGFKKVKPMNPYWEIKGITFEDLDGFRTVIQYGVWDA